MKILFCVMMVFIIVTVICIITTLIKRKICVELTDRVYNINFRVNQISRGDFVVWYKPANGFSWKSNKEHYHSEEQAKDACDTILRQCRKRYTCSNMNVPNNESEISFYIGNEFVKKTKLA